MKKLVFSLFVLLTLGFLLFFYVFPWSSYNIKVPFSWKPYKLGLDLQGWVELDYKVDLDEAKKAPDFNLKKERSIIEGLKSIIEKRIQTLNINDAQINDASYAWEKHIIVQIPLKWNDTFSNKENIKRAKEAIGRVVKIVFKERRKEITKKDLELRQEIAKKALEELKKSKYNFFVTANKYKDTYEKIKVWTVNSLKDLWLKNISKVNWVLYKIIPWEDKDLWKWNYILDFEKNSLWKNVINYIFIANTPSEWMPAKDSKWRILNDKYFVKSSVQFNKAFKPMVELTFNDEGKEIFGEITKRLVWKQMAIFVWWQMLTAPKIDEPILNWQAVITWKYYTVKKAKKLSQDINTWVVPAPIYLTSEKSIDSRLGLNSLQKIIFAWIAWFILIFLFLIIVYRLSGFVSAIALIMYILIVLAIVKSTWTVLTLASIAGLILSVWMAIDANVLIFERIREELKAWKNKEEASKIWFKKSWSAIWDSNITWLMVAIILFVFWINLIKWFWLMLGIWIVVSLFSAMYISRVFVILLAKTIKNDVSFIGK